MNFSAILYFIRICDVKFPLSGCKKGGKEKGLKNGLPWLIIFFHFRKLFNKISLQPELMCKGKIAHKYYNWVYVNNYNVSLMDH